MDDNAEYGKVYKVTNLINNKIYIGQTTQSISSRQKGHYKKIKQNSKTYFHNAIRKYNIENFIWEIIDLACNKEELNLKEKYYIEYFKSFNKEFGYNMTLGGEGGVPTKETREKISKAEKGQPSPNKGKPMSIEQKKLLSLVHMGMHSGEKHPLFGTKAKKETIEKKKHTVKIRKENLGEDYLYPNSKLSKLQVKTIKYLLHYNICSCYKISKVFNINKSSILGIKNGKSWNHIGINI